MRTLVLGGTSFLSRTVALDAVRRGHHVTCVARGKSGPFPDGVRPVVLDRAAPNSLDTLRGERFDAVVDVASMAPGWVRDALRAFGPTTGHWTYVSSINVYADTATPHQTTDAPLLAPIPDPGGSTMAEVTPEFYGAVEVAGENLVRDAVGERAFVVRPGQITGPGDYMRRFHYWPARFARGGRVVVPDAPGHPFQHIDVRDLAAWIVSAAENGVTGTFDAVSPVAELGETLNEIAALAAPAGTELVPVAPDTLVRAGVRPWAGDGSLPMWLPETHYGMVSHDARTAWDEGLSVRPLADTVHAALADHRATGAPLGGLTPDQERTLLA